MLCKTKKKNTFVTEISKGIKNVERSLRLIGKRRGARVVEEARLESVYTPKAYRGFESPSLRTYKCLVGRTCNGCVFFVRIRCSKAGTRHKCRDASCVRPSAGMSQP